MSSSSLHASIPAVASLRPAKMVLWWQRLLIAVAVVAILGVRKYDTLINPQLWAEDGGLFLIEAELHGWGVVFKPYEGYLHVLPRAVAALGRWLPLAFVPQFYAWFA